jgi:hypothetical protein
MKLTMNVHQTTSQVLSILVPGRRQQLAAYSLGVRVVMKCQHLEQGQRQGLGGKE